MIEILPYSFRVPLEAQPPGRAQSKRAGQGAEFLPDEWDEVGAPVLVRLGVQVETDDR